MKSTEQEIKEAKDADRILNDPLFAAAFHSIELDTIRQMVQSNGTDVALHHELVLTLQNLRKLRSVFTTAIQTGKMAEMQKSATRTH